MNSRLKVLFVATFVATFLGTHQVKIRGYTVSCDNDIVSELRKGRKVYECGDGQCYTENERCNSVVDCSSFVDEDDCDFRWGVVCDAYQFNPNAKFQCHNGMCIDKSDKCDGYQDCTDGSDEAEC